MKLAVVITPNAKQTELIGQTTDLFGRTVYRVKVAAPPIEGQANEELIRFLAQHFKVAKSTIEIVSGQMSRTKIVEIDT